MHLASVNQKRPWLRRIAAGEGHTAAKQKVREERIVGIAKVGGAHDTSTLRAFIKPPRVLVSGIAAAALSCVTLCCTVAAACRAQVVGVSKLRTKYESHEAKRQLCNSYDLFAADERILPSLPKLLGERELSVAVPTSAGHLTTHALPMAVGDLCPLNSVSALQARRSLRRRSSRCRCG